MKANTNIDRETAVYVNDDDGHTFCIHRDNHELFYELLNKGYKEDDFTGFEEAGFDALMIDGDEIEHFKKFPISYEEALNRVVEELGKDVEMYYGWQSNLAMTFYDEFMNQRNDSGESAEDIHKIANDAAKRFLNLLIK